jgi:mono/diheme cytochrome c family protein
MMAVAFMALVATRTSSDRRPAQMRFLGWWMTAGVLVTYGGYRWWEAALPDTVRALFLGDSPGLAALADTRHFTLWALAATLVLAALLLLALPRLARLLPVVLVMVAACASFAGYERLREGIRKPYLIHSHMFSNGLYVDQIADINQSGVLAVAGWAAREASDDPVGVGRQVFRAQCASCHTLDGYQGIRPLLPDDPDMITGVLFALYEMGEAWTEAAPGELVVTADLDYAFMPPFVGTEEELMALAEYLSSLAGQGAGGSGGGQ